MVKLHFIIKIYTKNPKQKLIRIEQYKKQNKIKLLQKMKAFKP